jgi:hypothetical protein
MIDLLTRLAFIVVLRLGPQDLPAGNRVVLACLGLYALVTGVSLADSGRDIHPLVLLTIAMGVPLAMSWIVLNWRGLAARFEQTVSALFGSSAVLSILTLPLNLVSGDQPPTLLAFVLLVVFFWSFAVDAHIWRHALNVAYSTGLAVAAIFFGITLIVLNLLAGSP